jgi:nicotinamide mononucleotide transporter
VAARRRRNEAARDAANSRRLDLGIGRLGPGLLALSWFLKTYTNTDVPHADGFLTAGSLVGQLLLARKKVENWHVWLVVDVLYVGLYVYKDLHVTAVLYAVFVVLAARGLQSWSKLAKVAP